MAASKWTAMSKKGRSAALQKLGSVTNFFLVCGGKVSLAAVRARRMHARVPIMAGHRW